jgi:predicted small secreted protein
MLLWAADHLVGPGFIYSSSVKLPPPLSLKFSKEGGAVGGVNTMRRKKGGIMRKLLMILMGGIFLASLAGCETAKGFGKDLEKSGENIQETIDKNQ